MNYRVVNSYAVLLLVVAVATQESTSNLSGNERTTNPSGYSIFEATSTQETTSTGKIKDSQTISTADSLAILQSLDSTIERTGNSAETSTPTPQDLTTTIDPTCDTPEDFEIINSTSSTIIIQWEPPANCDPSYNIFLNDELVGNTTDVSYTLTGLEPCENYTIGLSSISGENITEKASKTIIPTDFYSYEPENIRKEETTDSLLITWDPPSGAPKCVTYYSVIYWSQNKNNTLGGNTNDSFYDITPIVGCMNYTIQITPYATAEFPGKLKMEEFSAPIKTTTPPEMVVGPKINKTSMSATWKVQDKAENLCEMFAIIIRCQHDDSDLSWSVNPPDEIHQVDNGQTNRMSVEIDGLSEFTNYTCTAVVNNTGGLSEPSLPISFRTLEEIPDAPNNLTIVDLTPTSFKVIWEEPKKVPGVQENYYIIIESVQSLHYIGEECKVNPIKDQRSVDALAYVYLFENAYPDFQYNVSVFGNTEGTYGGNGTATTISVNTPPDTPNRPTNLTCQPFSTSNNTEDYNVTVTVRWRAPCNSNGPVKGFNFYFEANPDNSFDKPAIESYNNTIFINVNENETNLDYSNDIPNILPYYNYTVKISVVLQAGLTSEDEIIDFPAPDGYPGAPILDSIDDQTDHGFTIKWSKPIDTQFKITQYNVTIERLHPLHPIPTEGCDNDETTVWVVPITEEEVTKYDFTEGKPHYNYNVYVTASTTLGFGRQSEKKIAQTEENQSETVRELSLDLQYPQIDDEYKASVDVKFQLPCNLNGALGGYYVKVTGLRDGSAPDIQDNFIIESNSVELSSNFQQLKANRHYDVLVIVRTSYGNSSESTAQFETKSGVPIIGGKIDPPNTNDTTRAYFTLNKANLNEDNGEIDSYALFLATKSDGSTDGKNYGFWSGESWPPLPSNSGSVQQITEDFWNPFKDTNVVNFVIGENKNCDNKSRCNKELQPDTEYFLTVRILTKDAYRDITGLRFKTNTVDDLNLPLILGLIFGLLAAAGFALFIVIIWKRKRKTLMDKDIIEPVKDPKPINVKKFVSHYDHLEANYDIVKLQYTLIQTKSREMNLPITFANFPENRQKNRWTNILPFDETRVKLKMDEDDENCTDYINASYIKGYSGKVEYIASQGPLESTTKDFWKMVLQENVTIIVMVTQFVEQTKDKCFKYFPNNHESEKFGDIEVRCSTELHFGTYCIRTLQIRRDAVQHTVCHMQFLEWPDFGVPSGTEFMLQFCTQMRERHEKEDGLILIHCSAGVGRTGTLIALDILLQTIDHNQDIDVYGTVMNLRRQRTHMVQHEKQYMFLFTCLRDVIENPIPKSNDCEPQFHTYENLTVMSPEETSAILPLEESAL